MLLEIDRITKAELACLAGAVLPCAARDRTDKADISLGLEKSFDVARAFQHVFQMAAMVRFREEDRLAGSFVVHEMHKSLAKHAFPGAVRSHALSGRPAPEKDIYLILEVRIRKLFIKPILGLFHIIPRGWVSDIGITWSAALTKDWDHVMSTHQASWTEMHAMQIGDIRLMTGLRRETPIRYEGAHRVTLSTGMAKRFRIPMAFSPCARFGWAGDGSVCLKRGLDASVAEEMWIRSHTVNIRPLLRTISTEILRRTRRLGCRVRLRVIQCIL